MSNDNMTLWNSVCETDPAHTKRVNQRGGFTAIDAMYQVREATRHLGPVGKGWGWDAELIFQGTACLAKVSLWWTETAKEIHYPLGPVYGCKSMVDSRGKLDEDAPKKAVTDGLTKALSYLGFNADVFLGKFDDNKYVAQMNAKYGHAPASQADGPVARDPMDPGDPARTSDDRVF